MSVANPGVTPVTLDASGATRNTPSPSAPKPETSRSPLASRASESPW